MKKVLSRNNRFQKSYNVKYFKEIKRLKSPQKGGSEFSSYENELRKMTSHFELLTRS